MEKSYQTVAHDGQNEIIIKKSRFICSMKRVESVEEAQAFIEKIKKENYKANHNCSAYQIGLKNEIQHANDDGEPSGTAGKPMLTVLQNEDIQNVVAVTTRYFGGIKLGAGGLIRAYSHSVSETVKQIGLVAGVTQQEMDLTIAYNQFDRLQHFFEGTPYQPFNIEYSDSIKIQIFIDETDFASIRDQINDLLQGAVTISAGQSKFNEVPIK